MVIGCHHPPDATGHPGPGGSPVASAPPLPPDSPDKSDISAAGFRRGIIVDS
jgi:hypothetical protein